MKWWDQIPWSNDLMLSFKPTFSLSSFTLIKRLFSSLLSAIRGVSSAYLRLLLFLLTVLIPACDSSSPAFCVMYSAYMLNTALMYSFPNFEPVCFSLSDSNCCFLTCLQVSQEADKMVLFFHRFKNFPQFIVIHTVKGFGVVNEVEVDVYLELV